MNIKTIRDSDVWKTIMEWISTFDWELKAVHGVEGKSLNLGVTKPKPEPVAARTVPKPKAVVAHAVTKPKAVAGHGDGPARLNRA